MKLNYDKAYKYLEQYAKENNIEYFDIVEDSYDFEHGLLFIAYNDKEHKDEDFHVCIDVTTMQ